MQAEPSTPAWGVPPNSLVSKRGNSSSPRPLPQGGPGPLLASPGPHSYTLWPTRNGLTGARPLVPGGWDVGHL